MSRTITYPKRRIMWNSCLFRVRLNSWIHDYQLKLFAAVDAVVIPLLPSLVYTPPYRSKRDRRLSCGDDVQGKASKRMATGSRKGEVTGPASVSMPPVNVNPTRGNDKSQEEEHTFPSFPSSDHWFIEAPREDQSEFSASTHFRPIFPAGADDEPPKEGPTSLRPLADLFVSYGTNSTGSVEDNSVFFLSMRLLTAPRLWMEDRVFHTF